jgi:hypothetical protein
VLGIALSTLHEKMKKYDIRTEGDGLGTCPPKVGPAEMSVLRCGEDGCPKVRDFP